MSTVSESQPKVVPSAPSTNVVATAQPLLQPVVEPKVARPAPKVSPDNVKDLSAQKSTVARNIPVKPVQKPMPKQDSTQSVSLPKKDAQLSTPDTGLVKPSGFLPSFIKPSHVVSFLFGIIVTVLSIYLYRKIYSKIKDYLPSFLRLESSEQNRIEPGVDSAVENSRDVPSNATLNSVSIEREAQKELKERMMMPPPGIILSQQMKNLQPPRDMPESIIRVVPQNTSHEIIDEEDDDFTEETPLGKKQKSIVSPSASPEEKVVEESTVEEQLEEHGMDNQLNDESNLPIAAVVVTVVNESPETKEEEDRLVEIPEDIQQEEEKPKRRRSKRAKPLVNNMVSLG